MPTKKNWAGEQQEYNSSNGEYAKGSGEAGEKFDGKSDSTSDTSKKFGSFKKKYVPETTVEKKVDKWIEDNWSSLDQNKPLGMIAMNIPVRAPYPVVMDALMKSVAARKEEANNTIVNKDSTQGRGGLQEDFNRIGWKSEVVDSKTMKVYGRNNREYVIKENEDLGFDVYLNDKMILKDMNANSVSVAHELNQHDLNRKSEEGLRERTPDYKIKMGDKEIKDIKHTMSNAKIKEDLNVVGISVSMGDIEKLRSQPGFAQMLKKAKDKLDRESIDELYARVKRLQNRQKK